MTHQEFYLRPFSSDDLDDIIVVFQRAIRETASRDYEPSQIQAWSQAPRMVWEHRFIGQFVLLAMAGSTVAGFSAIANDGYLDMLFVSPEYQRKGVATVLLESLEAHARSLQLNMIVTEASITAKPFFVHHDFSVIEQQSVECRGEWLINYRMRKALHY